MKARILILLMFILASFGLVGLVNSAFLRLAGEPKLVLEEFPWQVGDWQGRNAKLTEESADALGAHSFLNRLYLNSRGDRVALHVAIWRDGLISPHHPQTCYPGAGWETVERRNSDVANAGPGPESFPMEVILFQRNGEQVITGHWYQVGRHCYTRSDSIGGQLSRLWLLEERPPTIKILVQTSDLPFGPATDRLKAFAELVFAELASMESRATKEEA